MDLKVPPGLRICSWKVVFALEALILDEPMYILGLEKRCCPLYPASKCYLSKYCLFIRACIFIVKVPCYILKERNYDMITYSTYLIVKDEKV